MPIQHFLNGINRLLRVKLEEFLIPLYLSITSSLQDFDRGHRSPYSKYACDTPLKYLNLNEHMGMFWKWALLKRTHRLGITIIGTVIHIICFSTMGYFTLLVVSSSNSSTGNASSKKLSDWHLSEIDSNSSYSECIAESCRLLWWR